jgi:hypothetical protein
MVRVKMMVDTQITETNGSSDEEADLRTPPSNK